MVRLKRLIELLKICYVFTWAPVIMIGIEGWTLRNLLWTRLERPPPAIAFWTGVLAHHALVSTEDVIQILQTPKTLRQEESNTACLDVLDARWVRNGAADCGMPARPFTKHKIGCSNMQTKNFYKRSLETCKLCHFSVQALTSKTPSIPKRAALSL